MTPCRQYNYKDELPVRPLNLYNRIAYVSPTRLRSDGNNLGVLLTLTAWYKLKYSQFVGAQQAAPLRILICCCDNNIIT